MQTSNLLWVNAGPHSRFPPKSCPEDRFSINSHIQRYRKRTEQGTKRGDLLNGSAAKAVVGWSTRGIQSNPCSASGRSPSNSTDPQQTLSKVSPASTRSPREDTETQPPNDIVNETTDISREIKLVHRICGKGEAVDPFKCTAVKFDSDAFDRLQFYLEWGSPMACQRQSHGSIGDILDKSVTGSVTKSMSDDLRSQTLLSYVTALMEYLNVGENSVKRGSMYHQKALETLRKRIQKSPSTAPTLLHDMAMLCRAAIYRDDVYGALTHIRAIKQVVDQVGGFGTVDPTTRRYVIFSDLRLAYARLAQPFFTAREQMAVLSSSYSKDGGLTIPAFARAEKPSDDPPERWAVNASLAELEKGILATINDASIPPNLGQIYREILLCAQVLESISANVGSSLNAGWLTAKHIAISTQLLSMSFGCEQDALVRANLESIRAILLLWDKLLMAGMAKGRTRNVAHPVGPAAFAALRPFLPYRVYLGIQQWNLILQTAPLKLATDDDQLFLQLVGAVREMEAESEVRLGDYMMRVYELQQMHNDGEVPGAFIALPSTDNNKRR